MPKKYSEAECIKFCEDWKHSGNPKIRFCKERNISVSALHKWLKKYGDQTKPRESSFKSLPIDAAVSEKQLQIVEITLPNGIMLSTEVVSLGMLIKELLQ